MTEIIRHTIMKWTEKTRQTLVINDWGVKTMDQIIREIPLIKGQVPAEERLLKEILSLIDNKIPLIHIQISKKSILLGRKNMTVEYLIPYILPKTQKWDKQAILHKLISLVNPTSMFMTNTVNHNQIKSISRINLSLLQSPILIMVSTSVEKGWEKCFIVSFII